LNKVYIYVSFVFFLLISCGKEEVVEPGAFNPTNQQLELIEDLKKSIIPLSGSSPSLSTEELVVFDNFGDIKMLGLGEATHGTAEFFEMKDRIFRYIVEKHGYRAFGFEMDFAEALLFNEFVQGGNADIEALMKEKMIFWTWRTEEVKDLLIWMREYNEGKPESERIHFFGFDCQYPTYNVPKLIELIESYDKNLAVWLSGRLFDFAISDFNSYKEATIEQRSQLGFDVNWVYDTIQTRANEIIEIESRKTYLLIEHLARTIVQTHDVQNASAIGDYEVNYRDLYMAENAKWMETFLDTEIKTALWAHNFHVAHNSQGMSMGSFLKKELGEEYKSLGFAFSTGGFNAFRINLGLKSWQVTKHYSPSTNYLFHGTGVQNFFLDLDNIEPGVFKRWLDDVHPFLSIGAVYAGYVYDFYANMRLPDFFDVIVYFDHTASSGILN
jgi:erythromycin esterase